MCLRERPFDDGFIGWRKNDRLELFYGEYVLKANKPAEIYGWGIRVGIARRLMSGGGESFAPVFLVDYLERNFVCFKAGISARRGCGAKFSNKYDSCFGMTALMGHQRKIRKLEIPTFQLKHLS